MVDLTSIDQTLAAASDPERCACGCGEQLSATGGHPWFASESCQHSWNASRGHRLAARRWSWLWPETETPADSDLDLPTAAGMGWEQTWAVFGDLAEALRRVVRRIGEALARVARELSRVLPPRGEERRKLSPPPGRRRFWCSRPPPWPLQVKAPPKAAPHRYKRDYRH